MRLKVHITQELIDKFLRQGRGQGELGRYFPWWTVFDIASKGSRTRVRGIKTGRTHHFLSLLELTFFFLAEFSDSVLDIREQYPLLPQTETLAIASQLGIKHSVDRLTHFPIVMTTDFLLTVRHGAADVLQAWSVKYLKDLRNRRTLDKEEVQRRWWESKHIPWKLFTEKDVTPAQAHNVRFLFPYKKSRALKGIPRDIIRHVSDYLQDNVRPNVLLRDLCADYEQRYTVEKGTGLLVARHLLANGQWPIDISQKLSPHEPLRFRPQPLMSGRLLPHGASQQFITSLA
ncbi:MAG: TnsA endonuclease N-terminal domain-containing protein [Nitrospira sp.]|nr:TnsA endonuclease N-terminal domain-containing protein [Nitrospira sp.]